MMILSDFIAAVAAARKREKTTVSLLQLPRRPTQRNKFDYVLALICYT